MQRGEVQRMTVKELYDYAQKNNKLDSDIEISVMFDDMFLNFSEIERLSISENSLNDNTINILVDRT